MFQSGVLCCQDGGLDRVKGLIRHQLIGTGTDDVIHDSVFEYPACGIDSFLRPDRHGIINPALWFETKVQNIICIPIRADNSVLE